MRVSTVGVTCIQHRRVFHIRTKMIGHRAPIQSLFFLCRVSYLYFPRSRPLDSVAQLEKGCRHLTHSTALEPQQVTEKEDSKIRDLGLARSPDDDLVKCPGDGQKTT